MIKNPLFGIISAVAMMLASLPAFAYVYLLFDENYFLYDFLIDDDVAIFSAIFILLAWLAKAALFFNFKDLSKSYSIALGLLAVGWILAVFGLGRAFDIYLLQSGFYNPGFGYTGELLGLGTLGLGVICIAFSLIYFSKFYKKFSELCDDKLVFAAGFLWIIGAIFPIFGGVLLFASSAVELICYKKLKI